MVAERHWRGSSAIVAGGLALCLAAVYHHWTEGVGVGDSLGPLAALALDGGFALLLAYAGYRLRGTEIDRPDGWRVAGWGTMGAVVAAGAVGLSMLIRIWEGRPISEPTFTLLLATEVGALAGVVAGYYRARALRATRELEATANGLSFVNSVIRHDLRNDLNVVDGYAERLALEVDDPELEADLDVLESKVEEAFTRLESTEVIARTLVGAADLDRIDLVPVVEDIAASVEESHDVALSRSLPERAPIVANEGVRSIVDNLVENAIEHTDAERPAVDVSVAVEGDVVRLVVSDDGPGIPEDRRAELLETTDAGSAGGLQIVCTLVDRYGGTIAIEDGEPRGTAVVVDLPAADAGE